MNFEKYINLVTWFFENDNREENYQNRVLIPFLETLCTGFDVVDTSMLTKEWDERGIERHKFAGLYTPDLLIASNWKLHKTEKVDYKSLIEIKTPTAQVNITLRQSRLSGVARATLPDKQSHLGINYCIMF